MRASEHDVGGATFAPEAQVGSRAGVQSRAEVRRPNIRGEFSLRRNGERQMTVRPPHAGKQATTTRPTDSDVSLPGWGTVPRGRKPHREPTAAHRVRLEEIKETATVFFYQLGYAGTDLRRIGAALDMHVSSLYNYVAGKEQLLYLILVDGMYEIRRSLEAALALHPESPSAQLRTALEAHIVHHALRRHRAWTSHVEVRALTGERLQDVRSMRREYEERWIDLLQRGVDADEVIDADPRLMMYSLLSIGQTVSRWYRPEGASTPEEIASSLTDIALGGVLRQDLRRPAGKS